MPPAVVLVHGAMHTLRSFEPLRTQLADIGITAHAPQLPSKYPVETRTA